MADELQDILQAHFSALEVAADNFCLNWPDDDGERQLLEGFRQTIRLAGAGHLLHLEADPANPLLIKMQSLLRQMMLPSVDAVYHHARLHGDYSYRLHGKRGTAHIFQVAIYQGSSARYPDFQLTYDLDSIDSELLAAGEDIDFILSASPRSDLGDRWIPIPAADSEIHIRQYYYDWDTEQPGSLMIEREGCTYPTATTAPADFRDRIDRLNSWIVNQSNLARQYVQSFLDADPAHLPAISIPGAFEGTRYLNGHYRCGPDEAVILEAAVPDALYWGFQLSNLSWEALDYYQRQTSLNGHQALVDEDGVFRAVISHQDPGIANWLDAGGRTLGLISGRYFKAHTAEDPRLKRVPLAELSAHLPAATARVTPRQRSDQLRQRLWSAHRRQCSDQ